MDMVSSFICGLLDLSPENNLNADEKASMATWQDL
jgi:hypothetical protein